MLALVANAIKQIEFMFKLKSTDSYGYKLYISLAVITFGSMLSSKTKEHHNI